MNISRMWLAAVFLAAFPPDQVAAPVTQLIMHSEPTDFIGQGNDYFFDLSNTTSFALTTFDYNQDGLPNIILAEIFTPISFWSLYFGIQGRDFNISEGIYPNASGFPTSIGLPFLLVGGDGRGDTNVTGEFTVLRAFFPSPVTHAAPAPSGSIFAVTFRQNCCGTPTLNGNLFGTLYFNFDPAVVEVPEPTEFLLVGFGLSALPFFRWARRARVRGGTAGE